MHLLQSSVFISLLTLCFAGNRANEEGQLKKKIFADYTPSVRPVRNTTNSINVTIQVSLNQIVSVDEVSETVTASLWIRLAWQDAYLSWNRTAYPDLKNIKVFPDEVWRPDIAMYNDIREEERDIYKFPLDIFPDGLIHWHYPVLMKFTCKLDVRDFPFDQQICALKFGSWSHSQAQIDLLNETASGDTEFFVPNTEWDLLDFTVRRHVVDYNEEEELYVDVTFYTVIRRKPLFYMFNLGFPCMIITMLSIAGFYLHPESGEKVSLQITTLLALTVFQLIVAESMPPQSEVIPCMGLYFGLVVFLVGFATLCTILVLQLHHRGSCGARVPRVMKRIFFYQLAPLVFMKNHVRHLQHHLPDDAENKSNSKADLRLADLNNCGAAEQSQPLLGATKSAEKSFDGANHPGGPLAGYQHDNPVLEEAKKSNQLLINILDRLNDMKDDKGQSVTDHSRVEEWHVCALIVDRISFIIILTVFICVTLTLFLWRPSHHLTPDDKKYTY